MKPFSKNLFSQTPVAFGWLPKETINLDISTSVWVCVRVCVAWMWVGDLRCFVLSPSRKKRELQQINKKKGCVAQTPRVSWNTRPRYHTTLLPIIIPHLHPDSLQQTPPQNILLCQHLTAARKTWPLQRNKCKVLLLFSEAPDQQIHIWNLKISLLASSAPKVFINKT